MVSGVLGVFLLFQTAWTPPDADELKKGIHALYSIKFDSAETVFSKYEKKYPERPEGYFFSAMILWVQVLLTIDDQSRDQLFFKKMDNVVKKCDEFLDKNPNNIVAEYYKGGSLGFKARLQGNRKEWMSAANNGRLAYPILVKALDGEIKFPDAKFGTGIYRYYAEVVPEKYPILKPIMYFFPEGNKEEGLKDLLDVAENGVFASDEANYFLIQIYSNYERNWIKAGQLAERMIQKYPENPFFQMSYGGYLIAKSNFESAKKIFENYQKKIKLKTPFYPAYQLTQCNFHLGNIEFQQKNYKKAIAYFDEGIKSYQKDPKAGQLAYYVESILISGFAFQYSGKKDESVKRFELVLATEEPPGGVAHQRAKNALGKK